MATMPKSNFLYFPPSSYTTVLPICGRDLINALVDARRFNHLPASLANITSLTIIRFSDKRLEIHILDRFFTLLRQLGNLEALTLEGFAMPHARLPSIPPQSAFPFPVTIRRLNLIKTNGASLLFILDCIQPLQLVLNRCADIGVLPYCEKLTLLGIDEWSPLAKDEMFSAITEWDGMQLAIEQCSFFDNAFVQILQEAMEANNCAVWPSASLLSANGCPASLSVVNEMWKVRGKLLNAQSQVLWVRTS